MSENNDELDPISFWILLLLSGGQQFTFHDLVRYMSHSSKEEVWDALQILQSKKLAKNHQSKFMIDLAGVEFLLKDGIIASEAEAEPGTMDFRKRFKPLFFSTWKDMCIWLGVPFALTFVAMLLNWGVTTNYGVISSLKTIIQISILVIYFILIGLYIRISHHYLLTFERLVVFRNGKAISKIGPGHVLLLPIIDNPKLVDFRERLQKIEDELCVTNDSILIKAGFYITWQVYDPILSLIRVYNLAESMSLLSAAILRSTIAEFTMENTLEKQQSISELIRTRIQQKAGDWGVQINNAEIFELQPPKELMDQIENRLKSRLESEASLVRADAQMETLRRLTVLGPAIDDKTINIYNSIISNSKEKYYPLNLETTANSTKDFLSNNSDYELFHLEMTLPNLLPIYDFYSETKNVLNAIDIMYSFIAIAYNEDNNALIDLISYLQSLKSDQLQSMQTMEFHKILRNYNSNPLLLSYFKYASPISVDLLGIGTLLKEVKELVIGLRWRDKINKEKEEIELKEKKIDYEQKQVINILERIKRVKELKLPKKQEELLLAAILPQAELISNSKINPQLVFIRNQDENLLTEEKNNNAQLNSGGE